MTDSRLREVEADLSSVARSVCLILEDDPRFLFALPPIVREIVERAGHGQRIRRAEARIRAERGTPR